GKGDVLDPLLHFLNRAAADVSANVGLAPELLTQIEKLVRAKMVVFNNSAPMGIDHDGPLFRWPNAIFPVVLVGEASARPAQDRHLDGLKRGDDGVSDAARIRDRVLRAHPEPLIDAMAEMLRKLTVNIAADSGTRFVGVDNQLAWAGGRNFSADSNQGISNETRQREELLLVHE